MELVVESYQLAARLPSHEAYVLARQLRRAALSIPANIAEGKGRIGRREYSHHISIALGSLTELDTLFEVAVRLNYLRLDDLATAQTLIDHVGRMLTRLTITLRP